MSVDYPTLMSDLIEHFDQKIQQIENALRLLADHGGIVSEETVRSILDELSSLEALMQMQELEQVKDTIMAIATSIEAARPGPWNGDIKLYLSSLDAIRSVLNRYEACAGIDLQEWITQLENASALHKKQLTVSNAETRSVAFVDTEITNLSMEFCEVDDPLFFLEEPAELIQLDLDENLPIDQLLERGEIPPIGKKKDYVEIKKGGEGGFEKSASVIPASPDFIQGDEKPLPFPEDVSAPPIEELIESAVSAPEDVSAFEAGVSREEAETHLHVPIRLIDMLINLAGEAVISRNELMQRLARVHDASLEGAGKKMSYLITRLQEGIMRTRLQELNTVFQKIPRIVRDATSGHGKKVELVVTGGEVELDKTLIDAIGESMMHMIRNAVDHGIEEPLEREKRGKRVTGLLRVDAQLRGGNVILTVKDDGRGLDVEKIREKAVLSGQVTQERSQQMSVEEVMDLVFLPGLSTARSVSRTSGRGVGMDVVRSTLKKVGGSVEIESRSGEGTTVTATLPQTLSIVTCLMVSSCHQLYALPQQNVVELILLEQVHLDQVEGHEVYDLRGHLLPLVDLGRVLGLNEEGVCSREYIVVVKSERYYFGLLIDRVVNLEEIVVKRLGGHFGGLSFLSGAAILGDGESVLILDVPGLAKFTNMQANASLEEEREEEVEEAELSGWLLFGVYDQQFAVSVETVPRIERIERKDIEIFMGIEVMRYRDEIVPVVRLEELYDIEVTLEEQSEYYAVIFQLGEHHAGILSTEIRNVVDTPGEVDKETFVWDSVIGHSILDGKPTLIVDVLDLLQKMKTTRFRDIFRQIESTRMQSIANEPER